MNLYLSAGLELISAFVALACGFSTIAWVAFGMGLMFFMLALAVNKVEER